MNTQNDINLEFAKLGYVNICARLPRMRFCSLDVVKYMLQLCADINFNPLTLATMFDWDIDLSQNKLAEYIKNIYQHFKLSKQIDIVKTLLNKPPFWTYVNHHHQNTLKNIKHIMTGMSNFGASKHSYLSSDRFWSYINTNSIEQFHKVITNVIKMVQDKGISKHSYLSSDSFWSYINTNSIEQFHKVITNVIKVVQDKGISKHSYLSSDSFWSYINTNSIEQFHKVITNVIKVVQDKGISKHSYLSSDSFWSYINTNSIEQFGKDITGVIKMVENEGVTEHKYLSSNGFWSYIKTNTIEQVATFITGLTKMVENEGVTEHKYLSSGHFWSYIYTNTIEQVATVIIGIAKIMKDKGIKKHKYLSSGHFWSYIYTNTIEKLDEILKHIISKINKHLSTYNADYNSKEHLVLVINDSFKLDNKFFTCAKRLSSNEIKIKLDKVFELLPGSINNFDFLNYCFWYIIRENSVDNIESIMNKTNALYANTNLEHYSFLGKGKPFYYNFLKYVTIDICESLNQFIINNELEELSISSSFYKLLQLNDRTIFDEFVSMINLKENLKLKSGNSSSTRFITIFLENLSKTSNYNQKKRKLSKKK